MMNDKEKAEHLSSHLILSSVSGKMIFGLNSVELTCVNEHG